jgi:hypothetical protein
LHEIRGFLSFVIKTEMDDECERRADFARIIHQVGLMHKKTRV